MLVRLHERIEVLCAPESQHLQFAFTDKFLQITVDGCQADVWQLAADFEKNLIRSGMRSLILDGLPNHFQLFGISLVLFQRTKSPLEIREQRFAGLSFQTYLGLIVRMFDQQRRFRRARESRAFIGGKGKFHVLHGADFVVLAPPFFETRLNLPRSYLEKYRFVDAQESQQVIPQVALVFDL